MEAWRDRGRRRGRGAMATMAMITMMPKPKPAGARARGSGAAAEARTDQELGLVTRAKSSKQVLGGEVVNLKLGCKVQRQRIQAPNDDSYNLVTGKKIHSSE